MSFRSKSFDSPFSTGKVEVEKIHHAEIKSSDWKEGIQKCTATIVRHPGVATCDLYQLSTESVSTLCTGLELSREIWKSMFIDHEIAQPKVATRNSSRNLAQATIRNDHKPGTDTRIGSAVKHDIHEFHDEDSLFVPEARTMSAGASHAASIDVADGIRNIHAKLAMSSVPSAATTESSSIAPVGQTP